MMMGYNMVLILLYLAISTSLLGSQTNDHLTAPPEEHISILEKLPFDIRLMIIDDVDDFNVKRTLLTYEEKGNFIICYHNVLGKKLEKITKNIAINRLGSELYNHTPFNENEKEYGLIGCSENFINALNCFYNKFIEDCNELQQYCHPNLLAGDINKTLWQLCASKNVSKKVIKTLVECGANVNTVISKNSVLIQAIKSGNLQAVWELIESKVDTNMLIDSRPPIYHALFRVKHPNLDIAIALIIGGATVDVNLITDRAAGDTCGTKMMNFLEVNKIIDPVRLEKRKGEQNTALGVVGGGLVGLFLGVVATLFVSK